MKDTTGGPTKNIEQMFITQYYVPKLLLQTVCCYTYLYYRVIALISVNIVPSSDIEGRELASVRRNPNEGQNFHRYQCDNPFII